VTLLAYQATAKRGEIALLFEDDIDLPLLPDIASYWTKRGSQRKVRTPDQNQKWYGFGAGNATTDAITHLIRERRNIEHFCALVEAIVEVYRPIEQLNEPKVVIIVDNVIIYRKKLTNMPIEQ
jgi:hypothetical protein